MSDKRLFTDQELKAMERRTLDILKETIDSGDKEKHLFFHGFVFRLSITVMSMKDPDYHS